MNSLTQFTTFLCLINYLKNEIESYKNWDPDVRHVLSGTDLTTWMDNKPADPSAWINWKACVDKTTVNPQNLKGIFSENKDEEITLNFEQGFIAMNCFLENFYKENETVLLKEIIKKIDDDIETNVTKSEFWPVWMKCISESTKFNEIWQ